jgi:MATE family multidrug resistance protein
MAKDESMEEALLLASRTAEDESGGLGVREEVKKQLWLAGPLIAGALLQNLIQMISVMYVGHLGELALAGASMASSFATVTGFSLLVRALSSHLMEDR